jgi:hypothetical protein
MNSEPRLSLREIAQYAFMSLHNGQGALAEHPPNLPVLNAAIESLSRELAIDAREARRLIETIETADQFTWYVEGRRSALIPKEV